MNKVLGGLGVSPIAKTCDDIASGRSAKNTRISAPASLAQKLPQPGADEAGLREHDHSKTGKQLQPVINPRMNQTVATTEAFRRQTAGGAPVMR